MAKIDIIRAWKDPEYRASLTEAERASVPANPAGLIELDDKEMRSVLGGTGGIMHPTTTVTTKYC